jgi:hypothetical protein
MGIASSELIEVDTASNGFPVSVFAIPMERSFTARLVFEVKFPDQDTVLCID